MGSTPKSQILCPCQNEFDCPEGAPGCVANSEVVIRFISLEDQLQTTPDGRIVITGAAFRKDELQCKNPEKKSASLLRGDTPIDEIKLRACNRNRHDPWSDDPVLARGNTYELRNMHDAVGRRETCVYADPITDQMGFISTHAYLRRSTPGMPFDMRVEWAVYQRELAKRFSDVRHFSGAEVVL